MLPGPSSARQPTGSSVHHRFEHPGFWCRRRAVMRSHGWPWDRRISDFAAGPVLAVSAVPNCAAHRHPRHTSFPAHLAAGLSLRWLGAVRAASVVVTLVHEAMTAASLRVPRTTVILNGRDGARRVGRKPELGPAWAVKPSFLTGSLWAKRPGCVGPLATSWMRGFPSCLTEGLISRSMRCGQGGRWPAVDDVDRLQTLYRMER